MRIQLIPAALTAVILAGTMFAQTTGEAVVISPTFVVEGRVVKGVPYSAQAVTVVKQTLATGSEITSQMTAMVARDAEGRTRREQTLGAIGPWAIGRSVEEQRDSPTVILIQDPVRMVNYTLDPKRKVARMNRQRSSAEIEVARRREAEQRAEAERRGEEPRREPRREPLRERPIEKVEQLGAQTIEGVKAQGRRTVTTFPAGVIGNSAPIETVIETWYSPELQVVVLGKRSDPRLGDVTYRLTNIKRTEPPASLFEVPAEYRIDGEERRF